MQFYKPDYCCSDEVAEWLRRWTANPLGSARVGSNPILVAQLSGSMVQWLALWTLNPAIRVQISVEPVLFVQGYVDK